MKKLLLILFILIFSSCAYFNIYYDANKYYNEAVSSKKDSKRDLSYKAKADSTISKASKLIQYYPKSNLVDNALLLMAKAYVLKGGKENYMKALTKLDEIEKYYKHKNLDDEINYLYAYIYYQNGEFEIALNRLSHLKQIKDTNALFLKAKCYVKLNENEKAIDLLKAAAKKKESKENRIKIYEYIGDLYYAEKNYNKSAYYYQKILRSHPNKDEKYSILLKISNDKICRGDYENALTSLEKLRKNAPDQEKYNLIGLSIADINEKLKKYDEALKIYKDIISTSHNDSLILKAIDRASRIEENVNNDMESAIKTLKSTKTIRIRDSLYYACSNRLESLGEIIKLTRIDSIEGDSLSRDSLLKNRLRIAELYEFNLNRPDKAKSIFFNIYNSNISPVHNDKILYFISWMYKNIYDNTDSAAYYDSLLVSRYPHSFYTKVIEDEKNKVTDNQQ